MTSKQTALTAGFGGDVAWRMAYSCLALVVEQMFRGYLPKWKGCIGH